MAAETFRIEIPIEVQDKTDPGVSSATKKVSQFDKTIEKTKSRMDEFNKTKFSAVIEAVDKASAVAGRIGTTLKGITGKIWSVTMSVLDKATAPIRGIINLLKNPLIQLGAVIGVTVSLKDTIDTFSTFEATMSKVQAVGEMTAEQLTVVTEKAKEMGRTTKFTATEAGEAFTYMAQAGWSTEQMLAGIDGVLALSSADGLDLASTASIVTDSIAAFGLQASDTARFADVLAKAAAATNVDVAQMGETFTYVAPIAGAMGYTIEDMSTAIGLMANASVKGSMAGTALKTAISNMVTPTDEQASLMKELGVSMTDSAGNANTFMTVMQSLRGGFSKLSATEKTAAASTLFGSYAMSGMLAIMNATDDSFNSLAESIENSQGTAEQMAEVMLDNVAGSFTLLQSAMEGVKISLGTRLAPYLRQFTTWLTGKMPAIEKAIGEVMDFVDEKINWLRATIDDFTSGEDWANADIWGKLKIAWDKIVAEPFSAWWSSTGKQFFIDKATSIGQGIGTGIRMGLLALLGIDVSETFSEGQSVGAGFLSGFKKGFDTEQITEALKEWASNNKEVVAVLGVVLGGKLIGGIYKGVKEAKSLVTDIKNIFGKGSGNAVPGANPSAYTTTTMTVTANIVNVYGKSVNNAGQAAKDIITTAGGSAGGAALGAGGAKALLTAGGAAATGTPLLLPGAVGGGGAAAAATGATAAGSWLSKLLTMGSTSSVIGADGTLLAVQGGLGGTLGTVGGALGSTATTAAGAAAAGAAGTGGIIGGILGLGSAAIDLFQGIGKSKAGDTKGAKDEYVTSGTKAGMVGAGAGAGALIGSVVPGVGTAIGALVGAGVGGVGALLGGDKAGKSLSDASDPGGWLSTSGKAIGDFFTKTLPKGWNSFWGGVGGFFTTTIPKWWGSLTDGVSTFFTETLPEKWTEFWEGVGDFFTETIPYAIGYAVGKAETFFTQDIPAFFGNLWGSIKTFFTSTLPTWASGIWNGHIVPFFTQDIPAFFSGIWSGIKTFFTSTLPTWASDTWNNSIVPFFTQDIPEFFGGLWNGITTFFTSTLPTWATDVWNNSILPFFTQTIPQFFTDLWSAITGFFTETLPTIASSIWGSIKGFFTDTIPNFFKDIWGSITGFFSAGYSDAKSGAEYGASKHAHGGIFTQPHMGLVAEAGAESIIPLSPSRRTRGIDLWRETGELLGVRPYANGGIIGRIETDGGDVPVAAGSSGGGVTIKVEVSANPEFTIGTGNAGDDERILSVMKAHIRGMADDIGDELAERLARIFVNMPVKA